MTSVFLSRRFLTFTSQFLRDDLVSDSIVFASVETYDPMLADFFSDIWFVFG